VIVIDAGVVVTLLADDGATGTAVRRRVEHERLLAPELLDLEVASALRKLVASNQLDPVRGTAALRDLTDLPVDRTRHTPLLPRCWELRQNVTVYDAAYVALAELFDVRLLTGDSRLARAPGLHCEVELVQPEGLDVDRPVLTDEIVQATRDEIRSRWQL
jgi:predicted nucleic acid-binding protein